MAQIESGSSSGEAIKTNYPTTATTIDSLVALSGKDDVPEAQKEMINKFIAKKFAEMSDGVDISASFNTEAQSLITNTATTISQLKAETQKARKQMDVPAGSPLGTAFTEAYKYTPEQLRATIASQIAQTKAILKQTNSDNTNHPRFQSEMKNAFTNQGLFSITGYAENMSEKAKIGFTEDTWQSPTIDTTILDRIEDIISQIPVGGTDEKARLVAISVATAIILRQCVDNLGPGWKNWVQNNGGTLGVAVVNLGDGVVDIVGGAAGILGSALVLTLVTGVVIIGGIGYVITKVGGGAIVSGAVNLVKAGVSKVGGKAIVSAAAGAVSGSSTATETPVALDIKNNKIHKAGHDAAIRSMYNQQEIAGGGSALAPNTKVPPDFVMDIDGGLNPQLTAEYNARMNRVVNLGNAPVGTDAKKIQKWQADFARAIDGEKDPSKWNLKAKKAVKARVGADATRGQQILRDAVNNAKTETIKIGSEEFKVAPVDKVTLNEIKTRAEEIEIQEKKKEKLEEEERKLEERLRDERKWVRTEHRIAQIPGEITVAQADITTATRAIAALQVDTRFQKAAKGGSTELDMLKCNADPVYQSKTEDLTNARAKKSTLETELSSLKQNQEKLDDKYPRDGINRNLTVDATGNLTNSTTMEELDAKTGSKIGIREKIRLAAAESTRLTGEVDVRLTALNANHTGIPANFTPNMDVQINGTPEKVSTISELFGKIVRVAVKK